MEHIAGGSLSGAQINGNHEKIYKWIFQISSALAYIHQLGIIHRDVKLGNLVRTEEDDVKLIDFGVSIFKENIAAEKKMLVGSPAYMAPEIILNK